jgi:hypothetical protein
VDFHVDFGGKCLKHVQIFEAALEDLRNRF